ncbi:MAG: DUF4410 domain-containing protein [Desulfobulbaceae bacterium]|nr:DUF4410 domain-containing protein [Desulfobulbaceae bacterium]
MKRYLLFALATLMLAGFTAGCVGSTKRVALPKGMNSDIAFLSLGADTTGLNNDQIALLQKYLTIMDSDMVKRLKNVGFTASQIKSAKDFKGNGHLLKVKITKHKIIPNGARMFAGMMAGGDVLAAHYELIDSTKKTVLSWDETQASSRNVYYCIKTLNIHASDKIASSLSGS